MSRLDEARRPLRTRDAGWARWLARKLAATSVTPNQISAAGLVAAGLAGSALCLVGRLQGQAESAALFAAAVLILLRLLANMLDGMVAIEGGKASPTGLLWNEVPDRIADIAILVGAGVACGVPSLGWSAAALAVLTAYLRVLGEQVAGVSDFSGPMAKPHRMAVVIVGCLLAGVIPGHAGDILRTALVVLLAGTAFTAARRCGRLMRATEGSRRF
ncbi:MAG: CDP-alcohol phosphatidyltransferase family protein [Pseudomonadota bacterium]